MGLVGLSFATREYQRKEEGSYPFFFSLHLPFSPPSNVPFHRRPQAPVWRLYRPVGPSAQLFYCVRSTLVEASLLHTHVHHVHVYAYRRATRLMTCINRVNRLSSWRLCGTSSVVVYPVETRQKKPDVMAHQMFFFCFNQVSINPDTYRTTNVYKQKNKIKIQPWILNPDTITQEFDRRPIPFCYCDRARQILKKWCCQIAADASRRPITHLSNVQNKCTDKIGIQIMYM